MRVDKNQRMNGIKMNKPLIKRKGIIFSLDAILSLLASMTLIVASFFYLSQINVIQWSQPNHVLASFDTLNVLRVDGTLEEAIRNTNGTTIKEFLDNMYDDHLCGSLQIWEKDGANPIIEENKTGCNSYEKVYLFRSTVYTNSNLYYVVLRTWYQ